MRLSWLIVVRDFVVRTFVRDDCHDRDVVVVVRVVLRFRVRIPDRGQLSFDGSRES